MEVQAVLIFSDAGEKPIWHTVGLPLPKIHLVWQWINLKLCIASLQIIVGIGLANKFTVLSIA
jgi:hypothetical protein